MVRLLISCALVAPVFGNNGWGPIHLDRGSNTVSAIDEIQWTPTRREAARRLDLALTASHTNKSDAKCIVGGFDLSNPLKIYIGGPCSKLTVSGDSVTPGDGFKYVVMETVFMQIADKDDKPAPFQDIPSSGYVFSKDHSTHGEVAVGGSQKLKSDVVKNAALFASTTSYLAKSQIKYTKNFFVVGKKGDAVQRSEQCIAPCCTDPGASPGCTCSEKCPTTELQAEPGQYKYSIMAAAYDLPGATAGATGDGWERVVAQFGTGDPKVLKDVKLDIFQVIDFTNMKADTLTITPPTGDAVKYKDMADCDVTGTGGCPTYYAVKSVTVESDGWSGSYAFPLTSNVGRWKDLTTTVEATRKVLIHVVKPTANTLTAWSIPTTNKVVLLRYRFDITGITAKSATEGKFMNYDPSITSGTKGSGSGDTTDSAPSMHNLCGLAALVMILAGIAFV